MNQPIFLLLALILSPLAAQTLPAETQAGETAAPEPAPALRLYTVDAGVHRVTYEELVAGGLPEAAYDSATLGLTGRGEPIPLWLDDGDDGLFGPGDSFEFVAEILHGETTWRQLHTLLNVYRLDFGGDHALRMHEIVARRLSRRRPALPLQRSQHLEEDRLLIRIESNGSPTNPDRVVLPDPWFWAKLTHTDKAPFAVPIDLTDLATDAALPVTLRVHFRALSRPRQKGENVTDHEVAIALGGSPLGTAGWDGKEPYLWESPPLAPGDLASRAQNLTLQVPRRIATEDRPLIDVVMFDWVEIDYPHGGRVDKLPLRVDLAADGSPATAAGSTPTEAPVIRLTAPIDGPVIAFGDGGSRITLRPLNAAGRRAFLPPPGDSSHLLADPAESLPPVGIETDRPSDLARTSRQADYLMIAHRSLLEATRPLADFHRSRGLTVALIDVQDIYDEFSHGIVDPRGIRDFVRHAYLDWQRPAPRFVLLVGDASWDSRYSTVDDANYANWSNRQLTGRDRFVTKDTTAYDDQPEVNRRNLIPTWTSLTPQGHAASDNYFVSVGGVDDLHSRPQRDDYLPDLAIGRLPVNRPKEVAAIVAKTVRRIEAPVGPWRRRILWITNDQRYAQDLTEAVAEAPEELGFESLKVYPQPEEADNAHHQEGLLEAFDSGQALVHFYGHGGRFIWRTGPPDINKKHDLFGLEQLDELAPNDRLPVVLSMSCFTAPFDHPNADSIGEKFLRLPDRGAVAVLGASWRNTPTQPFSLALVTELTRPGTVGEAIQAAKRTTRDRIMVQTYNLLGDPAIPNPVPPADLELEVTPRARVTAILPSALEGGEAIVDWLDAEGTILASSTLTVEGPRLRVAFDGGKNQRRQVRAVRVYVWEESRQSDSLGQVDLTTPE